jgi:uncharacterized DUF497 family protein
MTKIEWDADKAARVRTERGIEFADAAVALLEGNTLVFPSHRQDEAYHVGLVEVREKVWAVVHVWRGEALRIVTVRRARKHEERAYRKLYP